MKKTWWKITKITWTQLSNLGYVSEEYSDIPWSTFTQGDRKIEGSVDQAIENLKLTDEQTKLVDTDKSGDISPDEYLEFQDKFREDAARGLAKLANKMYGQPVETITSEKEIINKYKTNKTDGSFSVTRTNANSFYEDYTNTYLPVANAIKKLEAAEEFDLLKFYNTPVAKKALKEEFNYNPTKQKISTAEEIKQAFNKLNAGKKATDDDYIELPTEISEYPNGIFIANDKWIP